jgi:hypothetical protein
MSGGGGGRLVEKEQLGEATGLHQRPLPPAAELQATGAPARYVVAPADVRRAVVQAAPVSVDQAAFRTLDQAAERRYSIPQGQPRER